MTLDNISLRVTNILYHYYNQGFSYNNMNPKVVALIIIERSYVGLVNRMPVETAARRPFPWARLSRISFLVQ